ncbi:camp-dependent protein kinase catalytic subunit [Rhizophlyctis rosea]|nr:camp-dependent protein kinase catalytic subunit [Rhizophlyctis rosea]
MTISENASTPKRSVLSALFGKRTSKTATPVGDSNNPAQSAPTLESSKLGQAPHVFDATLAHHSLLSESQLRPRSKSSEPTRHKRHSTNQKPSTLSQTASASTNDDSPTPSKPLRKRAASSVTATRELPKKPHRSWFRSPSNLLDLKAVDPSSGLSEENPGGFLDIAGTATSLITVIKRKPSTASPIFHTSFPPITSFADLIPSPATCIGRGAFSRVYVVRHRSDQASTKAALKVMSKEQVLEWNQERHITEERKILSRLRHPFIVEIFGAVQDRRFLGIVVEYVGGGDLFRLVKKHKHFEEKVARFYAAEIVSALGYLHEDMGVVYRDLKPENVLLTPQGHIKLTDFGFAKLTTPTPTCTSFCGTPEYISPEMILRQPYGKDADYWSLGIMIFEMLAGYVPFIGATTALTYEKIVKGEVKWSSKITPVAMELIKGLLMRPVGRRLGCRIGGLGEVMGHEWFRGVDWDLVDSGEMEPPLHMEVQDVMKEIEREGEEEEGGEEEVWSGVEGRVGEDEFGDTFADF